MGDSDDPSQQQYYPNTKLSRASISAHKKWIKEYGPAWGISKERIARMTTKGGKRRSKRAHSKRRAHRKSHRKSHRRH